MNNCSFYNAKVLLSVSFYGSTGFEVIVICLFFYTFGKNIQNTMKETTLSFDYKTNNLNLIRLFAALQVLFLHLGQKLMVLHPWTDYLAMFNGVPIFFTLSGFLIYWSYNNNPNWKTYAKNRFLRIYPALLTALVLTIILLFSFGVLTVDKLTNSSFILWVIAQLTFFQEFTPSVVKGFGYDISPNAPLWTISVELLLYVTIPFLVFFIRKLSKKGRVIVIATIGLLSYIQNQTGVISNALNSLSDNGYYLIFMHPFIQLMSFYFFFCIGMIIYEYREKIIPLVAGKGLYFLVIYVLFASLIKYIGYDPGCYFPNLLELFSHMLLMTTVFSLAYTKPSLTNKLIGKTDISYGVYIYHMLVIQTFYELGLTNNWWYMLLLTVICFVVSWLSWTFIEKKALKLKKFSLYKN